MLEFYSDYQFITLALDVVQVLDSTNYFQSCDGKTVPCICAAVLSLSGQRIYGRLDSLAYRKYN